MPAMNSHYESKNVAKNYDNLRLGNKLKKQYRLKEVEVFIKLIDHKKEVLELGCGTGFLTKFISKKNKVVGVDKSAEMVKVAKKGVRGVKFIQKDIFKLNLKKRFDVVCLLRVISHFEENKFIKILNIAKTHLKSGGSIVFDVEDKSLLRRLIQKISGIDKKFPITYQYSIKRAKWLLKKANLKLDTLIKIRHLVGSQLIIKCKKI